MWAAKGSIRAVDRPTQSVSVERCSHDEGGRNWARFASLIGTCKLNGVESYAYLLDLFTKLAQGHLDKNVDALMPWAYAQAIPSSR